MTISAAAPSTSRTYTISDPGAASQFIPITAATPVTNTIPKYSGAAGLITNSSITDNGTTVGTTEALSATSATLTNTTNQLTLGTTNTVTISAAAPSTSRTYTISDPGAASQFIPITAATPATNTIPKYSGAAGLITNSSITDNGTTVSTTEALSATSATLTNTTNQLTLGTTNTTTLSATAPSASRTYTIPDAGAAADVALITGTVNQGGVVYNSSAAAQASSAAGNSGQFLLSGGTGTPTWGSAMTLVSGASTAKLTNNATSYYFPMGASVTSATDTTFNGPGMGAQMIATRSGTIKNLYVWISAAPTGTKTWAFTIMVDDNDGPVASAVTTTITGTAVNGSDLTHTATVNAGDKISIQVVPGAPAPAGTPLATWSFEIDYP